MQDRFQIILVEPHENLNIGAVARAMMNLGFTNLRLVSPREFDLKRAEITARWATALVQGAPVYTNFSEAIADCEMVVGFSMRAGRYRPEHATLIEWVEMMRQQPPCKVGLVFGPEDSGLRNEHIELCRWLIRIPSTDQYASFNLAQSVLLALYEVSRAGWPEEAKITSQELPTARDFEQLDLLVDSAATASGFYHKGTPQPLPGMLKGMLRRIDPDKREMNILLGLFGTVARKLSGQS